MSNEKNSKNNFSKFGYDLLKNYDDKYIVLLSVIASLATNKGYCYASNDYFFDNMYKMNKRKLSTRLDYLEANNLIARYFRISKNTDKNFRAKRIIVLTNKSYESYKSIDSTTKKPAEVSSDWLTTDQYNRRLGTNKKGFIKKGASNKKEYDVPIEMEENHRDIINERLKEHAELNEFMKP